MGGFIVSRSTVTRHGVFAEEVRSSPVIRGIGTGVVGLVGQFAWGPENTVMKPGSLKEREMMIAPPGMSRTTTGYLASIAGPYTDLHLVRVLGSAAVAASVILQDTTPSTVTVVTLTAKYKGTAGNDIDAIVSAASDGDANHFNLEIVVTGSTGTTSELYRNLNYSGTDANSVVDLTSSALLGSITFGVAGRPDNGTFSFTSGANGTIDAARYTGTAGSGDHGIALFEGDASVRMILSDDCGNTDRATVNSALVAHAVLKGDRIAILAGNQGLTASAAISAAALNRSSYAVFADNWAYIADDVDGTLRAIPPSTLFAVVASNLSPSTSPAWKGEEVGNLLLRIQRLETDRGANAGTLSLGGVSTLITEENGGYRFEAAVTTIRPADESKKNVTRTRIGQYIAVSVTASLRPFTDAPNVEFIQNQIVMAVDRFLADLKRNVSSNPIGLPHIVDYQMLSIESANSANSIGLGQFTIPVKVRTSSAMEQIFLAVEYGENVTVTLQEAA